MRNLCVGLILLVCASPAVAQPRTGTLLVLNKDDATLVTVDPATGKILGTVPTGEGPHEVAVSTAGPGRSRRTTVRRRPAPASR